MSNVLPEGHPRASVRSKTRSPRGSGAQSQEVLLQKGQQEPPVRRESKRRTASRQVHVPRSPLQIVWECVNVLQRVLFLALGGWIIFHTGNLFDGLVVVAIGFMNARWAKEILATFLHRRTAQD